MDRILPKNLSHRLKDHKNLIQVFTGPRQVGKTTAAHAQLDSDQALFASADLPLTPNTQFIIDHWQRARGIAAPERTLVLDEVQKIPRWSETVKMLWDEDRAAGRTLRVCLLGSSALLIEKGLSESLLGRFEVSFFPHWIFAECRRTFGASLAEYAHIGGYPKTYDFRDDAQRLEDYIANSIVEPALGRDVLSLHAVDKPALLRQLFWYVSRLPAQIVSYEKILGHLQGKGNSATLAHYAELLQQAFLLCPLHQFRKKPHRTKKSLPKWMLPNPGLVDATIRQEGLRNFTFENLIGSHLLNLIYGKRQWELMYWREAGAEIDFILCHKNEPALAIEVKSGRIKKGLAVAMSAAQLSCPAIIIQPESASELLETSTIEDVLDWANKSSKF